MARASPTVTRIHDASGWQRTPLPAPRRPPERWIVWVALLTAAGSCGVVAWVLS